MRHDTSPKDADPKLKGQFDGNCNRTACQQSIKGANFWNSSTRAYYCNECSNGYQGINYWSQRDEGVIICTPVTDENFKPEFPWSETKSGKESIARMEAVKLAREQAASA